MRVVLAIAFIVSSFAASQQSRGTVTGLAVTPGPIAGNFKFTITGTNPCSAVHLDFGDASSHTYSIRALPDSDTVWHHYTADGAYVVRVSGSIDCGGEATTRVNVVLPPDPRPARPAAVPPPAARPMRFAVMDRNGDRVITRDEWTGSVKSFSVHDWNRDGVLSGDEVEVGAQPSGVSQTGQYINWSEAQFRQIDRNRDNQITPREWPYELEDFVRIDRNRDSIVVLNEYLLGDVDDDRGDRFDDLDLNRNNRIEPREWHGSKGEFGRLDQNGDGVLSRAEVVGTSTGSVTGQSKSGAAGATGVGSNDAALIVSSRVPWTDTGINVAIGDYLTIQATGEIQYSPVARDVTDAGGVVGKPATANAPLPQINIGALIGRIGTNTAPFLVGASMGPIRSPRAGRLFLRVNDDILTDNRGEFRVSITVTRGPAR